MKRLNEKMYATYKDPLKYNASKIIVSGSDHSGEGEHKLFQHIRDYSDDHKEANTVIYGLDADLIMLSINHLPQSKYLLNQYLHLLKEKHQLF